MFLTRFLGLSSTSSQIASPLTWRKSRLVLTALEERVVPSHYTPPEDGNDTFGDVQAAAARPNFSVQSQIGDMVFQSHVDPETGSYEEPPPESDVDLYAIRAFKDESITVYVGPGYLGGVRPYFDINLKLFDSQGRVIDTERGTFWSPLFGYGEPTGEASPMIQFKVPADGIYYAGVSGGSNTTYDPTRAHSGSASSYDDFTYIFATWFSDASIRLQTPGFKQYSAPWGGDALGHPTAGMTMAANGCAVTALAEILHYEGFAQLELGGTLVPMNPGNLNKYALAHGDFSAANAISWGTVVDQVGRDFDKAGFDWVDMRRFKNTATGVGNLDDTLKAQLDEVVVHQGHPMIVRVPSLSKPNNPKKEHFVVVTGKDESGRYTVNDIGRLKGSGPAGNKFFLDQFAVRALGGYVKDPPGDHRTLDIGLTSAGAPLAFTITDPSGRVVDVVSDADPHLDIPGALYDEESVDSTDPDVVIPGQSQFVRLPGLADGMYRFQVAGLTNQSFSINLWGFTPDGSSQTPVVVSGLVAANAVSSFVVTFDHTGEEPVLTRSVDPATVGQSLAAAIARGLIDPATAASLTARLDAATEALVTGRTAEAVRQFDAYLAAVDAGRGGAIPTYLADILAAEASVVRPVAAVGLNPIADQTVVESTTLAFPVGTTTFGAVGPLVFTLAPGAPAGARIDSSTGAFTWTPAADQGPGRYTITIVVSAGGSPSLIDRRTFAVAVEDATLVAPPVSSPRVVRLLAASVPAGADPVITVRNAADGSVWFTLVPFEGTFRGGAAVAVGDVTGDGVDDVIVGAGDGGGPRVQVFDGATGRVVADFFAFAPTFRGGVSVAVMGRMVVTGAGAGGGPHVKVFRVTDGAVMASFFAFDPAFRGGVNIATGDINGDGVSDVVVGAGAGGGPHVKIFDGGTGNLLASYFVGRAEDRGGVRVAVTDADGDNRPDVTARIGEDSASKVRVYFGKDFIEVGESGVFHYQDPLDSQKE